MNMSKNTKIILYVLFIMMLTLIGGTMAYFTWMSDSDQRTDIVANIPNMCYVSVDGGGNVDSSITSMMPTTCTNSYSAIIREINSEIFFSDSEVPIEIELSLKVNSISEELSNSANFRYALTNNPSDCLTDPLASGTFSGVYEGDVVNLSSKIYTINDINDTKDNSIESKYYLYIWLDKAETNPETAGSSFSLSLQAQCNADNTFDVSGANPPVLDSGMIPVTISNSGVVTTISENDNKWYNYSNKEWANAVLVSSSSRNKYLNTTGVTVSSSDILAYYVWIPRFKYKIWTTSVSSVGNEKTIDIVFERKSAIKSTGTNVGDYLTHPAFTFGDQELSGFWVGKFETTGNASQPTVLPNVSSLRDQNVSTQFQMALKFAGGNLSSGNLLFFGSNTYGLTTKSDSHMMKNSEWGAVAYLTHSEYGINSEVRLNNNSNYTTGCGASSENGSSTTSCEIKYGANSTYPQSTTGNITGIFDMSGGAWEYVMGALAGNGLLRSGYNSSYNSGFVGLLSDNSVYTAGINSPDSKYYNLYTATSISSCTIDTCGGHALYETNGWYNDSYGMLSLTSPWFYRGGSYSHGSSAGIFYFTQGYGAAADGISFRSVLVNVTPSYSVIYDANGGSGAPDKQIITDDVTSITISDVVPVREGYRFLNWNTKEDGSGITYEAGDFYSTNESITLYAQWTSFSYNLSISKGNGVAKIYYKIDGASSYTSSTSNVNVDASYNTKYYYYGVASTGYTMVSCTVSSPCSVTMGTSVASASLTAKIITYNLSISKSTGVASIYYRVNGSSDYISSSNNVSVEVNYNTSYYYYGVPSAGYEILSCTQSNPCTGTVGTSDISKSISANSITYQVCYDANGGSGAPSCQTKTYGTAITLNSTKPTRSGYQFLGWSESSNATSATYSASGSYNENKSVTLFAVWKSYKVYFNFHVNGGTVVSSTTATNGNVYTWTTNNGIVYRSLNGATSSKDFWYKYHGDSIIDLPNWDNSIYLKITKSGYVAKTDAEWICSSGCTTANKTFGDMKVYSSSDFCDSSNGDCTVVLKVNWVDATAPTCSISATSGSTTLTATYSDEVGVVGYYFGTTAPTSSTTFTSMTSSKSGTKTGTVSGTGTYYFGFKDAAGNIGTCSGTSSSTYSYYYCSDSSYTLSGSTCTKLNLNATCACYTTNSYGVQTGIIGTCNGKGYCSCESLVQASSSCKSTANASVGYSCSSGKTRLSWQYCWN